MVINPNAFLVATVGDIWCSSDTDKPAPSSLSSDALQLLASFNTEKVHYLFIIPTLLPPKQ